MFYDSHVFHSFLNGLVMIIPFAIYKYQRIDKAYAKKINKYTELENHHRQQEIVNRDCLVGITKRRKIVSDRRASFTVIRKMLSFTFIITVVSIIGLCAIKGCFV